LDRHALDGSNARLIRCAIVASGTVEKAFTHDRLGAGTANWQCRPVPALPAGRSERHLYSASGFSDEVVARCPASRDEQSKAKVCGVEIDKVAVAFCPAT